MSLTAGFHAVPEGHLAAVVTHLQMYQPVLAGDITFPESFSYALEDVNATSYLKLFRAIGTKWLWASRLALDLSELENNLSNEKVETWIIRDTTRPVGLVELDFKKDGECELAFFGLIPKATGRGLGRPAMALAQTRAFSQDIARLHLHTCTLDDPRALGFYQKMGFQPYKREIEVFPDPRGITLPIDAAPSIPNI